MRALLVAMSSASLLLSGCASYGSGSTDSNYRRYDYAHPDPSYGGYDASRYYRDAPSYRERQLSRRDRVYRGSDDRYYCRRSDGSTGLIVGALAGGVLGNVITRGDSKVLGTILGAGAGALIGSPLPKRMHAAADGGRYLRQSIVKAGRRVGNAFPPDCWRKAEIDLPGLNEEDFFWVSRLPSFRWSLQSRSSDR